MRNPLGLLLLLGACASHELREENRRLKAEVEKLEAELREDNFWLREYRKRYPDRFPDRDRPSR